MSYEQELIRDSQIVPHLTTAIQEWIERVSKIPVDDTDQVPDVCIVEVRRAPIEDRVLYQLLAARWNCGRH
jgi:CTP synthase (UTP-ammonia lyase)